MERISEEMKEENEEMKEEKEENEEMEEEKEEDGDDKKERDFSHIIYDLHNDVLNRANDSVWHYLIDGHFISYEITTRSLLHTILNVGLSELLRNGVIYRCSIYSAKTTEKYLSKLKNFMRVITKKQTESFIKGLKIPKIEQYLNDFKFVWDGEQEKKEKEKLDELIDTFIKITIPYAFHYLDYSRILHKIRGILMFHLNEVCLTIHSHRTIKEIMDKKQLKEFKKLCKSEYNCHNGLSL
jgi:hypothetical protein